jgi:hypothetical protein
MNIKKIIREEIEGFLDSSDEDWDWANKIPALYIPRVGDKVRIKSGFNSDDDVKHSPPHYIEIDDVNYGGGSYNQFTTDDILEVTSITGLLYDGNDIHDNKVDEATMDNIYHSKVTDRRGWIIWVNGGNGLWSDAVEYIGDEH